MKTRHLLISSAVLWLWPNGSLLAQQGNEIQVLQKQLQQANEQFEKAILEHRQIISALQQRLNELQPITNPSPPVTAALPPGAGPADSIPQSATAPADNKSWSPADPLRLAGNSRNYLNLSIDGLFAAGYSTAEDVERLQLGGHDPNQRGFTVQNLEATFDGKVDPYFRAQANLVLQIDPAGETTVEAEEAYFETVSLPWNLQVKGGQFFTEFGRLNPSHPHTWDFVDQPLINARMFGPEGLRNPGARVSWLVPTPFYSEFFLAAQNSQGETATSFRNDGDSFLGRRQQVGRVKGWGDLIFTPRYVASFDLTDTQTLLAGLSAALGPNSSGASSDTQIYGFDLFWKWKPANQHGGFPFVTWQSEAMLRRYQAGAFNWDLNGNGAVDPGELDGNGDGAPDLVPRETLTDYGFYSQLAYGFRKGWVTALRGEFVNSLRADYERLFGRDEERSQRWRLSPNLTWFPTEFSKLRLQYNYDQGVGFGSDHSVWLQFEFLLGAHAAHKF